MVLSLITWCWCRSCCVLVCRGSHHCRLQSGSPRRYVGSAYVLGCSVRLRWCTWGRCRRWRWSCTVTWSWSLDDVLRGVTAACGTCLFNTREPVLSSPASVLGAGLFWPLMHFPLAEFSSFPYPDYLEGSSLSPYYLCTYCASLNLTGTLWDMLRISTVTNGLVTGFVRSHPQTYNLSTAYIGYPQVALTWCFCVSSWCMRYLECTV